MNEGCLDCGRGLHKLCDECECCESEQRETSGSSAKVSDGDGLFGLATGSRSRKHLQKSDKTSKPHTENSVGRPIKEPGDIQDKASTGRKRAAVLYPLFPDKPCDWQNLSDCGGGKFPIIGCIGGKQQHRHHGPDKNPLKNEPGNVHRICYNCHNIWHSQNNKDYDPNIKHSPRPATKDELADRMMKVRYCAKA